MALSQSDLHRLLESLRSADGLELVRGVAERMLHGADRSRGHREEVSSLDAVACSNGGQAEQTGSADAADDLYPGGGAGQGGAVERKIMEYGGTRNLGRSTTKDRWLGTGLFPVISDQLARLTNLS
jgi:hypothetical protein